MVPTVSPAYSPLALPSIQAPSLLAQIATAAAIGLIATTIFSAFSLSVKGGGLLLGALSSVIYFAIKQYKGLKTFIENNALFQKSNGILTQRLQDLRNENRLLSQNRFAMQQQCLALNFNNLQFQKTTKELQIQVADHAQSCALLSNEVSHLQQESKNLKQETSSLKEEREQLSAIKNQLQEHHNLLKKENKTLQSSNEMLSTQIIELGATTQLINRQLARLDTENEKLLKQVPSVEIADISQSIHQLRDRTTFFENFSQEIQKRLSTNETLIEGIADLKSLIQDLKKENILSEKMVLLQDLQQRSLSLQEQLQRITLEIEDKTKVLEDLGKTLGATQQEIKKDHQVFCEKQEDLLSQFQISCVDLKQQVQNLNGLSTTFHSDIT
jgi:chromosome segregation ATPase